MFLYLLLNFSLIFGLLGAPSLLLVSLLTRRRIGKAVFAWSRPEMVLLTIVFSVLALIHLIIGVSCLFSYWGYLEPGQLQHLDHSIFLYVGIICMANILGLIFLYFAARMLLVQLVLDEGIVLNRAIAPGTYRLHILNWEEIVDYYHVSDYPNAVFTFIYKTSELKFARKSIRVPIYFRDDFLAFTEQCLSGEGESARDNEISSPFFNEN